MLSLARVEVGIENRQVTAILVKDFISLHVGMIDGYLLVLTESDAIEAVGQSKHALYHLFQLEVRPQHLGIDVIAFHLQLVGIIAEVPWLQFKIVSFHLSRHPRHVFPFL